MNHVVRGDRTVVNAPTSLRATAEIALLFFFFQAEDGIRDHCVTGVQTCALPIYGTADRPDVPHQRLVHSLCRNDWRSKAGTTGPTPGLRWTLRHDGNGKSHRQHRDRKSVV